MNRTLLICMPLIAAACSPVVQTTSGSDYLADTGRSKILDPEIARAANIEPQLRFPARIGVARIVNARLTSPGSKEADKFADFAARNARFGEFIPVSPLVAAFAAPESARETAQTIRIAAARQHLDYVLVYEVGARSNTTDTPFALADATIIGGAFLPTRQIAVTGIGQAILLDVRNGYPYGTAMQTVDLSGYGRTFAAERHASSLRDDAIQHVTEALIPEVEAMFKELETAL
ncbi:MAG: hypothetical protein AAGG56_00030 [Pseudomonadota bacterium]